MNYIDAVLLVVIVIFGFRGFANGFIAEVCSLVGILIGVYLGSMFAVPVGEVLTQIHDFHSKSLHTMLGFLCVLGISWIFFMLISYVLSKQFTFLGLGFVNKSLGFVFACVKIFFVFSICAYALSKVHFIEENVGKIAREQSQIYVNMLKVAQFIIHFPEKYDIPQMPEIPQDIKNMQKNIKSQK
ncbi:CvpA family protein [Helicobacter sp. T3_23-1056]